MHIYIMHIVLKSSCGSVYVYGLCEIKVWNSLLNAFVYATKIRIHTQLRLYQWGIGGHLVGYETY
jgi:hypothetical protein